MFDQIIDSIIKWFVKRAIFSSRIFFIIFSTIFFQIKTNDDNLIRLFFQESCVSNFQIRYVFLVTTNFKIQLIDRRFVSNKRIVDFDIVVLDAIMLVIHDLKLTKIIFKNLKIDQFNVDVLKFDCDFFFKIVNLVRLIFLS